MFFLAGERYVHSWPVLSPFVSKFQQAEVGDFVMSCPLLSRFVLQCDSIFTV